MSTTTVISLTSDEAAQSEKKMSWTHAEEEFVNAVVQSEKPPTIREMLQMFADETSMHGVKNAAHGKRHVFHRTLWGLMVLGMAGWLAFTAADLYLKYLSHPYTTSIDVSRRKELPFPAITLCIQGVNVDRNYLANMSNSQLLREYLLSITELRYYTSFNWTSDDLTKTYGNASFEDIFHNASMDVGDIFTFGVLGSQLFFPYINITVQQVNDNKCFSYNFNGATGQSNAPKTVKMSEYLRLFLRLDKSRLLPGNMLDGLSVYIHKPDEPVGENDIPINVPVDSDATILLDRTEYSFLPEPYLSFSGTKCVDTLAPGYQSPLSFNLSYTWNNCITEASIKHAIQTCNCVSGWSKDFSDLPRCNLAQTRDCFYTQLRLEGNALLYGNKTGNCLPPCTFSEYKTEVSVSTPYPSAEFKDYILETFSDPSLVKTFNGYISLKVGYESSLVTVMEHHPAMSIEDIYSTLGGQMGFFLGASLLTMTELVEAIVFLVWTILATKTKGLTERCKALAKVGTTTHVTAFS